MNRSNNPFAAFFALASKLRLDHEMRYSLCRQFSNNRTSSLPELNSYEYAALVRHLRMQAPAPSQPSPQGKGQYSQEAAQKEKCDVMRKKVFSLLYSMGYIYGNGPDDKKINAQVVYGMVERKGYLKPKKLNAYTFEELPRLVSQFEHMSKNNDKTAARKEVASLLDELKIHVAK